MDPVTVGSYMEVVVNDASNVIPGTGDFLVNAGKPHVVPGIAGSDIACIVGSAGDGEAAVDYAADEPP